MIRLNGFEVGKDIKIQCTGLKDGEKLHEELHAIEEKLTDTAHPKIKRIQGSELTVERWQSLVLALQEVSKLDNATALNWLRKVLPDFRPE